MQKYTLYLDFHDYLEKKWQKCHFFGKFISSVQRVGGKIFQKIAPMGRKTL